MRVRFLYACLLLALGLAPVVHAERAWDNGPRAVPRARGAAFARAEALGIGGHYTTKRLLWSRPGAELLAAVPGDRPHALLWPVVGGKWGRGFGYTRRVRTELRHNGIDIGAPAGTAVRAAADGLVIYSDNTLRHLGNAVLILHPGGWTTLYAHNARTTVQPGWFVKRGERIALVGQTGAAWGPHVHFELRDNGRWIDPAPYLVGYRDEELSGPLVALNTAARAAESGPHEQPRRRQGPEQAPDTVPDVVPSPDQDPDGDLAPGRESGSESESEAEAESEADPVPEPEPEPESESESAPDPSLDAQTAVSADQPAGDAIELPVFDYGSLAAVRRVLRGELALDDREALGRRFSNLLFPVKGGTLGRGFERSHRAVDLVAGAGAPVRAAADGVVLYSGPGIVEKLHAVVLLHRGGWVTVYGALREDGAAEAGTRVLRGEWIGRVAEREQGSSELHFAWYATGTAADPSPLLIGP